MSSTPRIAALVVAAGIGARAGAGLPKQYRMLGPQTVLAHSMQTFLSHPAIALVQVVIHPEHAEYYQSSSPSRVEAGRGAQHGTDLTPLSPPPNLHPTGGSVLLPPVTGGAERAASVRAGLAALAPHAPDYVLVHDAARPFISHALLDRIIVALNPNEAIVPALPVADTVRRQTPSGWEEVPRDGLWRMQTPQAFPFATLYALHQQAHAAFTDDAALWLEAGHALQYVQGQEHLRKMTTAEDFDWAQRQFPRRIATGSGYDVHALVAGDRVVMGGVSIPHDKKLDGHSDADVALHALTDALLGTIGAGDIGTHFPPSDARWKGADSATFVREAMRLVNERGGILQHADITIICEAPKIGPHREAMRARIAALLEVPFDYISVKATTTEQLGFTGRREGIAAQATATVSLPCSN